jgi:hypothetical protein
MAHPTLAPAALAFVASLAPAPNPTRSPNPNAPRPVPARDTIVMDERSMNCLLRARLMLRSKLLRCRRTDARMIYLG